MKVVRQILIALLLLGAPLRAFETVVIDPGHGGHDEGTSWFRVKEKDVTLAVARRLENILRDQGVNTLMTRRYDHYVSLDDRAKLANSVPDSVLLSIHFNGSGDFSIHGFEVFHFFCSPSSRSLAESIYKSLDAETPGHPRNIKPQDYAVLSRSHGLAVLVECGFLSNKGEAARLTSNAGQEALAKALADGLMRIKPLVDCDPPLTATAKWAINSRKLDAEARKLAGLGPLKSSPVTPTKHATPKSSKKNVVSKSKKKKKKKSADT